MQNEGMARNLSSREGQLAYRIGIMVIIIIYFWLGRSISNYLALSLALGVTCSWALPVQKWFFWGLSSNDLSWESWSPTVKATRNLVKRAEWEGGTNYASVNSFAEWRKMQSPVFWASEDIVCTALIDCLFREVEQEIENTIVLMIAHFS